MGKSTNAERHTTFGAARLGRGLSAGWRQTQSWSVAGAIAAVLALAAPSAMAESVGTMMRGDYACELPGDALGRGGIHQPQEDFSILAFSLYDSPQGRGTYLASGNTVTMTSGPRKGDRYRRISPNFLRKLTPEGHDSVLRCIRRVTNNSD